MTTCPSLNSNINNNYYDTSLAPLEKSIYSTEQLALLDNQKIPSHVAFIPDGNRRWAKKENTTTDQGHREGADTIMNIVKSAKALGIKTVTFYIFSTENWSRPEHEILAILWLLQSYLIENTPIMIDNGIKFTTIGDIAQMPLNIYDTICNTVESTASCDDINLVFAINYGSRNEICRAVQSILADFTLGKIAKNEVNEQTISNYLDTAGNNDPDLLIRTSGEMRISNFLLWQSSYTEIYSSQVLWPDFNSQHFLEAILNFQTRKRRLGL